MMQTILGSGGSIGVELAKALSQYTDHIRLVSRHPKKVNPTDEIHSADLLDAEAVRLAVKGSSIVYVTIGFEYNIKVWQQYWPSFIGHVIKACRENGSRLVFFDNIYMYDPNYLNGMTEKTPIRPSSKKGKVRAEVAQRILDAVQQGELTALIARSADFYGPSIKNSILMETVFKPLGTGKKANWLGGIHFKHSYTYTPDAGKATAILGNTEDAYNQVWHLPTAANPFTGKQWIETIAAEMNVKPRFRVAPKILVRLLGLFMPIMRETAEMIYQYDRDYVFDSSKFEQRFKLKPTPYLQGVKEIVKRDFTG